MSAPAKPDDDRDDPPATEAVLVSEIIPATRERIFAAWMNSDQHSAFTGDRAIIDPSVGGSHSSFDGYASGTTMSLEPFRRIVQTWRSIDFPKTSPDSLLEITLEETVGGTLVTLLHSEIPTGQSDSCREGWLRLYLEPLKRYFTGRIPNGVHPADKKALAASRKQPGARRAAPRANAFGKGASGKGTPPSRKVVGRAKTGRPAAGGKTRPAASKARPAVSATKSRKKAGAKTPAKAPKTTLAARKRKLATRRSQTPKVVGKRGLAAKSAGATKAARASKTKRKPRR